MAASARMSASAVEKLCDSHRPRNLMADCLARHYGNCAARAIEPGARPGSESIESLSRNLALGGLFGAIEAGFDFLEAMLREVEPIAFDIDALIFGIGPLRRALLRLLDTLGDEALHDLGAVLDMEAEMVEADWRAAF